MTQLTEHFSIRNLCYSREADRLGLSNTPSLLEETRLKQLCIHVLEPLWAEFGRFDVLWGYRSKELLKCLGKSGNSPLHRGEGVVIKYEQYTPIELVKLIRERDIPFDQIIISEAKQCILISYNKKVELNRRDVLISKKNRIVPFVEE